MDITKSDKHCVLIADDNPENLDVLSNILEEDGYRVRTSRNGKLALESIETSPVDLVLADIHMPEMDGYELCKKLKANPVTKDIPVIFVSAIDESFNKVIAFELGGVDYLTKPVEPKEVQARVRTHLKIQSLQNELRQHNESLEQMVDERNQKLKDAIDQLKDMNVRLQKLDQAKSDFLELISHELRTPLNGLGVIDAIVEGKELSEEESKEYQDIFWSAHQKLLSIADRALMITSLKLDKPKYTPKVHSLRNMLQKAIKPLKPLMDTQSVSVELPEDEQIKISCDDDYFKMAFNALLETSIKFTKPEQKVEISYHINEEEMDILIDTVGWTIPDNYMEHFFDVMSIPEAIFPGGEMGLAPAVAKQIISVCGGTVDVENRKDGIRLTVKLPENAR